MSEREGWYQRGYLPHLELPQACQAITFRLGDAVPVEQIEAWHRELETHPSEARQRELRHRLAAYEDAGHGACILRDERCADVVATSLAAGHGTHYRLHAWVVMPNHVHALIGPPAGQTMAALATITHGWKGATARAINRLLGRSGPLWQRESFDRWIRDEHHFAAAVAYIENNPQRAGLINWPWVSSSRERRL